jgi:hypothetical protein
MRKGRQNLSARALPHVRARAVAAGQRPVQKLAYEPFGLFAAAAAGQFVLGRQPAQRATVFVAAALPAQNYDLTPRQPTHPSPTHPPIRPHTHNKQNKTKTANGAHFW